MQSRIVRDNGAPIGAEANVEFETVATLPQRLIEGEKSVFRRAPARPAMPQQQGAEMLRMRMSEYSVVVVHAKTGLELVASMRFGRTGDSSGLKARAITGSGRRASHPSTRTSGA
jgi:hypothetical protein